YMSAHQHSPNANELWLYFKSVIDWVKVLFKKVRKEMKSVPWGLLYNQYKFGDYDAEKLEEKIALLMQDDDVTKKSGIYEFLFDGKEKHLSIRAFTPNMKRGAYERQQGICPHCKRENREKFVYLIEEMEADHILPWCDGGKTSVENCQMLCREHNRQKSGK
ncbi:MAG: HNH endonuclease, partial [Clostridia bacterium]|nr:HNH endonuclease [Clostridia bacterium]